MSEPKPDERKPLPAFHVRAMPRVAGQTVDPTGVKVLYPGDSLEVHVGERTIRLETFEVTDAMKDADRVRFAYTAQLAEEGRKLQARVAVLEAEKRTIVDALERMEQTLNKMEEVYEPPIELPPPLPPFTTPFTTPPSPNFLGDPLPPDEPEPIEPIEPINP